jgi:hypothetical protein
MGLVEEPAVESLDRVCFVGEDLRHVGPAAYGLRHIGSAMENVGVVVGSSDRTRFLAVGLRRAV